MAGPLHVLSARLQSDTPVSTVALEPYVLCRRADGTTVSAGRAHSAGNKELRFPARPRSRSSCLSLRCPPPSAEEVPAEGHTDSRFSVKCRWYRSVVTKGGQVGGSEGAASLHLTSWPMPVPLALGLHIPALRVIEMPDRQRPGLLP